MLSEVYDIECLSNLFTYTGYCRQDKTYYQFVIHQSKNEYKELIKHLFRDKLLMIGYNNENYDYPIIHHLINHYNEYIYLSGFELSQKIYEKSQEIIDSEFTMVADYNKKMIQIDLMRVHNYHNSARLTSLKSLEIALQLENVEDMPYEHFQWITKDSEIQEILNYNKNDVYATNEFLNVTLGDTEHSFYKGKNKIFLRQTIQKKYGVSGLSKDDVNLGVDLLFKLYCTKLGKSPKYVKSLKTPRPIIYVKDCIPKWADFKDTKLNKLLTFFKSAIVKDGVLKDVLNYSLIHHGIKINYGAGGAHACIKPGIYKSDEEWLILDLDIDSMYPNLAISQGLYPEHLGIEFLEIYDGEIVSVRVAEKKKPKKERDFVIVEGFKLAANGSYGKSNEETSWLYDPLYTLKTTVSGQVLITMWVDRLLQITSDLTILQINTDGLSVKIKRKDLSKLLEASDQLMIDTSMSYEANIYKTMVIRDVNNYIAEYEDGSKKYKGVFEIDKELYKDPSMKIVPIALDKYFFENIPIAETLRNHTNIYDFCMRFRVNKGWNAIHRVIEDFTIKNNILSKNTRYYVSTNGGALIKSKIGSDSEIGVNVGFVATPFNKYYKADMKDYKVNYNFYIAECRKIIDIIENNQLTLF